MLPEDKGQIPPAEEGEMPFEQHGDPFRSRNEPTLSGRVLGKPAVRGGEKELAPRAEQGGEPVEEGAGIVDPIEKVGGEEEVEALVEGGRERVAEMKFDTLGVDSCGKGKFPFAGLVALERDRVADRAFLLEQAGGLEKGFGVV